MSVLCASSLESVAESKSLQLADAEQQASFFTVARVGDYIVAANSNGLFRTKSSTKNWERVQSPEQTPPHGQFSVSSANTNSVFLCAGGAIYASRDSGATWKLVSKARNFHCVYENQDGKIYAIVEELKTDASKSNGPPNKGYLRWSIVVSDNEGRTWEDITSNIGVGVMLIDIFPDPASSKRVCLLGNGIRSYVLQATDDHYTKWNTVRQWDWGRGKETDEAFLREGYSSSTVYYILKANLANYFDYPFGNSPDLPAFEIQLQTNHFEFQLHSDIQISVSITFLPAGETVKLADVRDGEEFWRVNCINPSGERITGSGKTDKVGEAKNFEALKQSYRKLPDFRAVDVSLGHPYNRDLSLSKLVDFSRPGTYRVCVSYDSSAWGWDQDSSGHGTRTDVWGGHFSSPVFTVTIKP